MRITNGMMMDKFLYNLQNNIQKMDKYTNQLANNRKIVRLSDDPIGVLNALTARERLARFEQYQRNLDSAQSWVDQCDTSLQELSAKLTDFRDQVINAATNVKTDIDRQNIVALCKELKASMMETLNASVGKQYIFAGYNATNQPFTVVPEGEPNAGQVLYNGLDMTDTANPALADEIAQQLKMEVGFSLEMDMTMNGLQVVGWGEENLFKHLDDVITLMEDPSISAADAVVQLSGKLGNIDTAHTRITTCLARTGALQNRIEILQDRYSEDIINYNEIRSKIEDIDSAEVIMDWKMAESVYKQSLSTGARIIMPTLMDFLR